MRLCVQVITELSTQAEEFLRGYGLDLAAVSHCGGHAKPRTHRFPVGADGRTPAVGWTIMKRLQEVVTTDLADRACRRLSSSPCCCRCWFNACGGVAPQV